MQANASNLSECPLRADSAPTGSVLYARVPTPTRRSANGRYPPKADGETGDGSPPNSP